MNRNRISQNLNKIYNQYHSPEFLTMDPLCCVRRYSDKRIVEIVGLISSCLSYGRVERIIISIDTILDIIGDDIISFITTTSFKRKCSLFKHFKHRFNTGLDIAILLEAIKRILSDFGSIENYFYNCFAKSDKTMKSAMGNFVEQLREVSNEFYNEIPKSFKYLLPSPHFGSACKRLNMYFRWMIRVNDGIDFGIWNEIPSSILIIPVDVHVAKIAKSLGLTTRNSVDWKMAEEITTNLKKIDPEDPIKFDFSMCRYGMYKIRYK